MVVDPLTAWEGCHTHPAYVGFALRARHMIAPLGPLYGDFAAGTWLDTVVIHPLLEEVRPTIGIWTPETIVGFDVTVRADSKQA